MTGNNCYILSIPTSIKSTLLTQLRKMNGIIYNPLSYRIFNLNLKKFQCSKLILFNPSSQISLGLKIPISSGFRWVHILPRRVSSELVEWKSKCLNRKFIQEFFQRNFQRIVQSEYRINLYSEYSAMLNDSWSTEYLNMWQ